MLDDAARLAAADPGGMLDTVEAADEHWRDAVARARSVDLSHLPDHGHLTSVVVCGMGGSGIAGDVAACLAADRAAIPVSVAKGYELPAFAGPHTLVVLSSYSGGTEETLACFRQAHDRGAPIVAVATGGALGELAHAHDAPCVVPAGGMMPRAAFPYLAGGVLVILERLGVLPDLTADLVETDEVLREQAATHASGVPTERNPAKQIAVALVGRIPVIWGQEGPLSVAATRWKTQLNENAKVPAYAAVASELTHNEIVGFSDLSELLERHAVVALRSSTEHPRVGARLDAALRLVTGQVGTVVEAHSRGSGVLARLASAVQLGDLVSVYLAFLRAVDPTPIEPIDRLKAELT
ncbi:MAG: bifunctional phosphoglucose/phosphomannose isomerase [Actinomycetota bacterium]